MKGYAVITGASSGIGMEFAKCLSAKGYPLILIARRKKRLLHLRKRLRTVCEIIIGDLTNINDCENIFHQIENKKIDLFINNAGFGDCGHFSDTKLEKDLKMIQLNVAAVHYFTKQMFQKMKRENYGYILNVASSAGLIPAGPYMASYYATKAYVTSLTRAIAMELQEEKSNVYIGCLCPGPVNTEFNKVANVEFALPGISPSYCARYALRKMEKRKIVIVPSITMKLALFSGRFLPQWLYIRIVSHQQKRKLYRNKPRNPGINIEKTVF